MAEREITCIVHDTKKRITHVGLAGSNRKFRIRTIIRLMGNGHKFFTRKNNRKAKVVKRTHPNSRRKYLTTNPDSTNENNLDFLRQCT
jgi:hypothetical protein